MELLLTKKHLTIVERELEKRGPNKGKMMDIVKRYEYCLLEKLMIAYTILGKFRSIRYMRSG